MADLIFPDLERAITLAFQVLDELVERLYPREFRVDFQNLKDF